MESAPVKSNKIKKIFLVVIGVVVVLLIALFIFKFRSIESNKVLFNKIKPSCEPVDQVPKGTVIPGDAREVDFESSKEEVAEEYGYRFDDIKDSNIFKVKRGEKVRLKGTSIQVSYFGGTPVPGWEGAWGPVYTVEGINDNDKQYIQAMSWGCTVGLFELGNK